MGANPGGIVLCACHGRSLMVVKYPYNCSKRLFSVVQGRIQLDRSHSYYILPGTFWFGALMKWMWKKVKEIVSYLPLR